ncbi:hypothetical protein E1B28_009421 [Marasmius oreades]|uniref:Uncharacterized protein n=1 Tax=Marasmius oreades TaxID=181124 RepID=A0A9P7UT58_9AGAR|nr:uncharacterized protein E1B28_009421 [Marasmius oreades]KAG7093138.1 hypothetical protein E1B28_009421 [Marasmius oreades]
MASVQDYLTGTVDNAKLRARVAEGGVLHDLPETVEGLGTFWAGKADVPSFCKINQDNTYTRSYVNIDNDNREKVHMYIGEVLGFNQGTALAPYGNFSRPAPETISDKTSVRQILVLGSPSFGNEYVKGCFGNQAISVLDAVEAHDNGTHMHFSSIRYPFKRLCVGDNMPPDALIFHTEKIYQVPPSSERSRPFGTPIKFQKANLKRKLEHFAETSSQYQEGQTEDSCDVKVGDFIDPKCLPGYTGGVFQLGDARCVVQDIKQPNNAVVHPKDWSRVLTPGALVWIGAVLKAWIMPDGSNGNRKVSGKFLDFLTSNKFANQFYHLSIVTIDIIDFSPFEPITRGLRAVPHPIASLPIKKPDNTSMFDRNLLRPRKTAECMSRTANEPNPSPASTISSTEDVESSSNLSRSSGKEPSIISPTDTEKTTSSVPQSSSEGPSTISSIDKLGPTSSVPRSSSGEQSLIASSSSAKVSSAGYYEDFDLMVAPVNKRKKGKNPM